MSRKIYETAITRYKSYIYTLGLKTSAFTNIDEGVKSNAVVYNNFLFL